MTTVTLFRFFLHTQNTAFIPTTDFSSTTAYLSRNLGSFPHRNTSADLFWYRLTSFLRNIVTVFLEYLRLTVNTKGTPPPSVDYCTSIWQAVFHDALFPVWGYAANVIEYTIALILIHSVVNSLVNSPASWSWSSSVFFFSGSFSSRDRFYHS